MVGEAVVEEVVLVEAASQVTTRFETAMSSSSESRLITNFKVMLVPLPWLILEG